ncbi:MAG: DUF3987 domain-containing protein [Rhodocyclales bacterium]|nr:DUF3987 domain-containing protein [Rhodocyclales bacterium]
MYDDMSNKKADPAATGTALKNMQNSHLNDTTAAGFAADCNNLLHMTGYYVIPVKPGSKTPAIAGWPNARMSYDELRQKYPFASVGVLCGVGENPIAAIDIDVTEEALAVQFADWCKQHLGAAPERIGRAPKRLLVYRAAEAGWQKKSSRKINGHMVEILGARQQFVAFGLHPDTGNPYAWTGDDLQDIPASELPVITQEQVADALQAFERMAADYYDVPTAIERMDEAAAVTARVSEMVKAAPASFQRPNDPYADKALQQAILGVATASEGERNNTLNREAFGIGQLAAAGRIDAERAKALLLNAALNAGLPKEEAIRTINSAFGSSATSPNYTGLENHAALAPVFLPLLDAGGSDAWPDPTPLPDELPPVEPFDERLLPEALRGWVMDIAERMQCPSDFPAVGAITALSGLIGARAVVAPKQHDDWRVVPNLWGLIIGRPGVMKSPALAEILKPLHMLEANGRERWQKEHAEWELDTKVAEMVGKANENKAAKLAATDREQARLLLAPVEPPKEPKMRRYVVNDSTVEALAELLVDNPWGVLVYRDEVHGLLCSMDRQGQEGARSFYLTGYDGNQGYAVDRILRGHSYAPRVCISLLGGIQPGKVQSYVREAVKGGASDDGLLQRFGLAVWPDINREFQLVDRWPDTEAKRAAYAVFERLNGLLPATDEHPKEWRFSPEAQADFYKWLVPFEEELRGDELHPALVSHLAKYRKLVPALALIFALVDTPDADGVIHEQELTKALAWSEYLRTHAERLYAAAVIPETTGAHALLAKIKGGKLCDGDGAPWEAFTPRQVAVKHWAGLTSVEDVRKAAELLVDYGWLAKEIAPPGLAGGRPSERYLIHPSLLVGRKS